MYISKEYISVTLRLSLRALHFYPDYQSITVYIATVIVVIQAISLQHHLYHMLPRSCEWLVRKPEHDTSPGNQQSKRSRQLAAWSYGKMSPRVLRLVCPQCGSVPPPLKERGRTTGIRPEEEQYRRHKAAMQSLWPLASLRFLAAGLATLLTH